MKKYYPPFKKDDPTLVDGLKGFIASVNLYLANQAKDPKYYPSKTRGQSKVKDLTIEEDPWKLTCKQHRENAPFTDKVFIFYDGVKVWYMCREIKPMPEASKFKSELQRFFWEVAECFDKERPWCGPQSYIDKKTGLHYTARHSGTDEGFQILELVTDVRGRVLWQAICEGGFVI